jgi:AraC-type DNA-binding domain-containing proteins
MNNSNKNFVNYIVDTMDNQIEEIKQMAYTYGKDSDVILFSHSYGMTGGDSITLRKIMDKFIVAKATKNIIDDIFIYYKAQNMVVSAKGTFEADFFFNKYILNLKEQIPRMDTGMGRLLILPKTEMKKLGNDYDYKAFGVISYIYPINRNSYLQIMVNEGSIKNNLYEASYDKDNIIVILDNKGKLISGNMNIEEKGITSENLININSEISKNNNVIELANGKYIINGRISKTTGFNYFVIFPMEKIQAKAAMVNRSTYFLVLALLLVGVFLTAVLSKVIYIPVKGIMNLLNVGTTDKRKNKTNEFDAIRREIDTISRKNEEFINTLQKQQPFVEEIFLNRLMSEMSYDYAADVVAEMNLKYRDFVVLSVIMAESDPEIQKAGYDKLENFLDEEVAFRKLYSHSNENLYIIRVNENKNFIEKVKNFMYDGFVDNDNIILGVSCVHSNILEIKKACKESMEALKYRATNDTRERVFRYESISTGDFKMARINLEEEIQLINNVFNGNSENVVTYIKKFVAGNRDLPFKYQKNAYIYLANLLLMTMSNKSMKYEEVFGGMEKDFTTQFDECENANCMIEMLYGIYQSVTDYCGNKAKGYDSRILNYVNENFHKGICLEQLAEKMGLSATYVSAYFKRVTGVNFLIYVNNLRLKKAKEMLADTDKSVAEIAEILGFGDSNTFIRLFKKMEGITPGIYKKGCIKSNN